MPIVPSFIQKRGMRYEKSLPEDGLRKIVVSEIKYGYNSWELQSKSVGYFEVAVKKSETILRY